jgi:hypothetical protein
MAFKMAFLINNGAAKLDSVGPREIFLAQPAGCARTKITSRLPTIAETGWQPA